MDFTFSDEEEVLRGSAREFCKRTITPRIKEMDSNNEIPDEIITGLSDMGFLSMTIPPEYGGSGASFTQAAIIIEELGRADISLAIAAYVSVVSTWSYILNKYGTDQAKEEILPEIKKKKFLGIAATDPKGGSDLMGMRCVARKDNNVVKINGEKTFVSGVREALKYGGGHILLTKTDSKPDHKGFTFCYTPIKDTPNLQTSLLDMMGREAISDGTITYQDYQIPEHYVLGEWGKGIYIAMEGFNCARSLIPASCIGAAERALEIGAEYVKNRKAFGSPIGKFEGIQFQLAEDYTQLETAKLLTNKATWLVDRWQHNKQSSTAEVNKITSMAKLTGVQFAFDAIKDVMMWHGGTGYTKDAGLERGLRGVMSYVLAAEGTFNIMKIIIGREILGKEFTPYSKS